MKGFYFKIFNSTWEVSYVDHIKSNPKKGEFVFGETDHVNNKIRVAIKDNKGNILPETTIHITALHEMVHAILGAGQYEDCSNNEALVEWIANCIYSLKQQKKL